MAAIGDLVATLRMNTKPFKAGAGRARKILGRLAGMMTALAPLTGAAAFAGIVRSGETFNQKMRQSLAIMGDVSDAMKGDMREAAFDVASATRFSAAAAAESYYFLASAGLDAAQSIAALPQVAAFAQAGNFDMATATDLATDSQSALGLTVKDSAANLVNMTRVTDVLTAANTMANASSLQFSEALTNKAGPALRSVNKDIEEGVAVLAALADQGIKGQEAGTGLAIVMRDLQTKAIKNKSAFAAQGVSVYDSSGKMNNMADIMGDLEKATGSMNDMQKKAALLAMGFSDKSMHSMMALMGTSEKIREYENQLRQAGGTTQEVADKQLTPLQKLWAKIGSASTQGGVMMVNAINSVINYVGSFSDSFATAGTAIASAWSETWTLIANTASAVFQYIGVSANGFEENIRGGLEAIAGFFDTLAFTVRNFGNIAKMAINNLVLSALEAFPQMENPITNVAEAFISTWAGVKAFFGSIVGNIIGGLKEIKNFGLAVGAAIQSLWESMSSGDFAGAASAAGDAFINTLAKQKDVIAPNAFAAFRDAAEEAGTKFRDNVKKSGGLGGALKKANTQILEDIANDETARTLLRKREQGGTPQAAFKAAGINGAGKSGAGKSGVIGEKDKLPKALMAGSKEAMNRIMRSGKTSKQEKDVQATAEHTKRTADATEEMVQNRAAEYSIP